METKNIRTWNGFVREIDALRRKHGNYVRNLGGGEVYTRPVRLLFRGQDNAQWKLETTLERNFKRPCDILQYLRKATRYVNEIESFTNARWGVPASPAMEVELKNAGEYVVNLPAYEYLVYMRHHGFPSPLLDWTESVFIAAYFAYITANKKNPAVYCYIERPRSVKVGSVGSPTIAVQGPYVTTHRRHFAQKACYTIATQWNSDEQKHYFCSHEAVFNDAMPDQDLLYKFTLPISQRSQVLAHLDGYHINHFTLFQSEDSLVKALATKEFDLDAVG